MNRIRCSVFALAIFAGCDCPATTTQENTRQETTAPALEPVDAKVVELFSKFQQLPDNEKDTLKGDQIILQIEGLMGCVTMKTRHMVEKTVQVHNARLLKRALEDTSANPEPEVIGTEILGLPRERK